MAVRATAPLRPGDAMAVVAASSAVADAERLHQGVSLLESWGLRCRPHSGVGRHWGYLAGRDEQRLADLLPETPVS